MFTNANAQAMITVNYGTNWQTAGWWASLRAATPLVPDDGKNFLRLGRTAPLGFKYWEIGNEIYGGWETDANNPAHDPYTYAVRARDYLALMKAVDPTVKIGVVALPGEDAYANYTNHPATNPRTGLTHNGWTPVMLATLKTFGASPDFLIHHPYPESPGGETMPTCCNPPPAGPPPPPACGTRSRITSAQAGPTSNCFAPKTIPSAPARANNPPASSTAYFTPTA